jgi:alkylation response protein AidB-like acyl-CoA dehydrogenase
MTQIEAGWGEGPSERYEELAARFRPVFRRIREGAVAREANHVLPAEEIGWLKELRFGALRVPAAAGGAGATLPELFALLIELSEADSNITQALRGHFGFAEDIVNSRSPERQAMWFPRLAAGDIVGNAWTEIGDGKVTGFSTSVVPKDGVLRLNGQKYYTTGSYLADWIDVGATDAEGNGIGATVGRDAPGVRVVDDWNGFGQTLTVSGTATFADVAVDPRHIVADEGRPPYFPAFFQLVHLATLAGLARAAASDAAQQVGRRRRTYSHANSAAAAQDPQVLAVIGRARSAAYVAGSIVQQNARAVQRAFEAGRHGDAAALEAAVAVAELEVCQSLTVVSALVLEAATTMFDALGASATSRDLGLDRYWRNARTLASHNPRIYKDRIVGDFAVNGTRPPPQWRIGLPA